MSLTKFFELANHSGGTLYLMALLLLVALTVIIERTRHLLNMQQGGEELMDLLRQESNLQSANAQAELKAKAHLPQARVIQALQNEPLTSPNEVVAGHLEEALMHEVPLLDRSLWMLDTVITLAPLLGLLGTIIGMFHAFSVLDDVQNNPGAITGGIAEALIVPQRHPGPGRFGAGPGRQAGQPSGKPRRPGPGPFWPAVRRRSPHP